MSIGWIISNIALWVLVLVDTIALVLLLRVVGEFKQKGGFILPPWATSDEPGGLAVGEKAPLFSAADLDGNSVRLEDFRGKKCILAFLAPGCSFCAKAVEALNSIVEKQYPVAVLAVGGPDATQNHRYASEWKAQMPILTAGSGLSEKSYHVYKFPFIYLLDEEGVIRAQGLGGTEERLRSLLTPILAANTHAQA